MSNSLKKKNALVLTVPYNHAFALACVILDLKKYSPKFLVEIDDIIVYHNGIKDKDQKLINLIHQVEFLEYKSPLVKTLNFDDVVSKYFTLMIFSRFESLKLLNQYKCVVYSDYDILIKGEISEILDFCESGWKVIPSATKIQETLYQPISDYKMDRDSFSGGLFILWDHLSNYNLLYEWCYMAVEKYANYLYIPDIAIFCLLWQEFNIEPLKSIDTNIYCCHPSHVEYIEKAKIIHAYGPTKFWNGWNFKQWEDNYKTWIEMGGGAFSERSLNFKLRNQAKAALSSVKKFIAQIIYKT